MPSRNKPSPPRTVTAVVPIYPTRCLVSSGADVNHVTPVVSSFRRPDCVGGLGASLAQRPFVAPLVAFVLLLGAAMFTQGTRTEATAPAAIAARATADLNRRWRRSPR